MDPHTKLALTQPTIPVPTAARLLGLSRNGTYEAIKRGELPSIRVGGRVVVPTAPLRKMLGLEVA